MRKTMTAVSCMALLGAGLVLAAPSYAETTPTTPPPAGATATMPGMPMGGQMMKMREEGMAMRQKMDAILEALQKDQAQLKIKADKATLAKLDKDLTDLQEAHKQLREKREDRREMMEKHRQMMPQGGMLNAPAPTPMPMPETAPAKE